MFYSSKANKLKLNENPLGVHFFVLYPLTSIGREWKISITNASSVGIGNHLVHKMRNNIIEVESF